MSFATACIHSCTEPTEGPWVCAAGVNITETFGPEFGILRRLPCHGAADAPMPCALKRLPTPEEVAEDAAAWERVFAAIARNVCPTCETPLVKQGAARICPKCKALIYRACNPKP